ncbi:MAG: VOC family protein [Eubacteriales bacterium]|nr:VOC family protein [Eubacteriales bacterium]
MYWGSTYLIVKDFERSIRFYEALLAIPVTHQNMERFAMFEFDGKCLALMNGYFDTQHPDKVVHKGSFDAYFDDLPHIAALPNTRKAVLNFCADDLAAEYARIQRLPTGSPLTGIKYVCNVHPYYYFQLADPDGNIIEITGGYTPAEGEFEK